MMKRIIFIIAVTFCLSACEKQERSHWLYNMWSGEYDITMTNNDTGEKEPHVGVISLEFSDDRSACVVQKGVTDLYAVTRKTFKAYLNEEEKSFMLNEGDYDSRILYWGQITADGKSTLNFYSGDELVTVELVAHKLE
ncbi:MAG: hypothetical protein II289_03445 [Bacteroidales bacterium]|nr:hypothetical protein [Bacteroidales bacterium]